MWGKMHETRKASTKLAHWICSMKTAVMRKMLDRCQGTGCFISLLCLCQSGRWMLKFWCLPLSFSEWCKSSVDWYNKQNSILRKYINVVWPACYEDTQCKEIHIPRKTRRNVANIVVRALRAYPHFFGEFEEAAVTNLCCHLSYDVLKTGEFLSSYCRDIILPLLLKYIGLSW